LHGTHHFCHKRAAKYSTKQRFYIAQLNIDHDGAVEIAFHSIIKVWSVAKRARLSQMKSTGTVCGQ
jgi:hypothetical protein